MPSGMKAEDEGSERGTRDFALAEHASGLHTVCLEQGVEQASVCLTNWEGQVVGRTTNWMTRISMNVSGSVLVAMQRRPRFAGLRQRSSRDRPVVGHDKAFRNRLQPGTFRNGSVLRFRGASSLVPLGRRNGKANPMNVSDRNTSQGPGRNKPSRSSETAKTDGAGVGTRDEGSLERSGKPGAFPERDHPKMMQVFFG